MSTQEYIAQLESKIAALEAHIQTLEGGTGGKCNRCGMMAVIRLSSIDKKICSACHSDQEWPLKPGQESVLIRGKKGERD